MAAVPQLRQDYYTYQLLLDLKVGKEWRCAPSRIRSSIPTRPTTVPVAVPALLRTEWWPMISFVVFKSPAEGRTHVFRPGEPMLQILILPADVRLYAGADGGRRGRRTRDAGAADSRQPPRAGSR